MKTADHTNGIQPCDNSFRNTQPSLDYKQIMAAAQTNAYSPSNPLIDSLCNEVDRKYRKGMP